MSSDEMMDFNDERLDLLLCTLDHDLTCVRRELAEAHRREGLLIEALGRIQEIAGRVMGTDTPGMAFRILETVEHYRALAESVASRPVIEPTKPAVETTVGTLVPIFGPD